MSTRRKKDHVRCLISWWASCFRSCDKNILVYCLLGYTHVRWTMLAFITANETPDCSASKMCFATVIQLFVKSNVLEEVIWQKSLSTLACPLSQLQYTASTDHQETTQQCRDCLHCHWSHVHGLPRTLGSQQTHALLHWSTADPLIAPAHYIAIQATATAWIGLGLVRFNVPLDT